MQLTEFSLT